MKKFKQTMSGILALLMVLTSFTVMPAVSAAETILTGNGTLILNETFDDWSVSNTGKGWSACSSAYDVAKTTETEGNNVLSVTPDTSSKSNTGIKYIFDEPINEGTLNISYDLMYSGGNTSMLWPSLDSDTIDSSASPNTWGQGYPRINAGIPWVNHNLSNDVGTKGQAINGDTALTQNNWYTVIISVKPAISMYDMKIVDKATGAVFGQAFTNQPLEDRIGDKMTQIAQMTFRSWDGTNYIDNVIIEYVEPVFENLNETFDNWSVSNTGTGWSAINNPAYDVAQTTEVEGDDVLSVTAIPASEGGLGNTGIKYVFSKVVKEGTLNISYDLMYSGGGGEIFWPTLDKGTADTNDTYGQFYPRIAAGAVRVNFNNTSDAGTAYSLVNDGVALTQNHWYTVVISAKPAKSKYDIKIIDKETGAVFGQEYKDQPLEDRDGNKQTEIAQMAFRSWDGTHYIDNIAIELDTTPEPPYQFEGINETFDNWSVSGTGKGWSACSASYDVAKTTEVEGNKVLSVTPDTSSKSNTGIKYIFPEVIDAGELNISYDLMYSGGSGETFWPALDWDTIDNGANPNTWGQGYPRILAGTPKANYNLDTDRGTAAVEFNPGVTLTQSHWYTITINVRPADSKYDIKIVDKETGKLFGEALKDQPLEDRMGDLMTQVAQMSFRSWDGTHYIDNVVITHNATPGTEPEPEPEPEDANINETFDNWSVSNTGKGWSKLSAAYTVATVKTLGGGNNVLDLTLPSGSANHGVKFVFPEAITGGTLDISYDLMYKNIAGSELTQRLWVSLDKDTTDLSGANDNTWGQGYPAMTNGNPKVNYNLDNDRGTSALNFNDLSGLSENTWYTVMISVKPSMSKYTIRIVDKATGAVFGKEFADQPLEDRMGNLMNKVAQLTFRGYAGENYIDNVVIAHNPIIEPEPGIEGIEETFDNWTVSTTGKGWGKLSAAYTVAEVKTLEDGNKVLNMTLPEGSANHGIKYIFPEVVENGTLNINYDILYKNITPTTSGAASQGLWPSIDKDITDLSGADNNTWGQGYPNMTNGNPKANYNLDADRGTGASNFNDQAGLDENTWYTVMISIKPAKSKYDMKIVNTATGETFGKEFKDQPLEDRMGNPMNKVAQMAFRVLAGENYIDNVIIEHIPQQPELSAETITMYDSFGVKVQSLTAVSRALGKIELDFGIEMIKVDGIKVTGTNVPTYSVAIDNANAKKAIITFTGGMFDANSTYTLTVPAAVTAINGNKMSGEFVLEFKTGVAQSNANMTSLTVGGAKINSFAELAAKDGSTAVINANFVNTSDDDMSVTYIVAYYNGKRCLEVNALETITVGSEDVLAEMPTFTIDIPDGATNAKVFCWSTLSGMIPYCEGLEF